MSEEKQDTASVEVQERRIHELERAIKERQLREFGSLMGQSQKAAPKPWVDLSIEEKIERTRDQVKDRENELRYVSERMCELQREVRSIRREMIDHRHDLSDRQKVMLPADRREELNDTDHCGNAAAPDVDPAKLFF